MQLISKFNKGFRFLLCVIDIFSKYTWVVPLKYKKGIRVLLMLLKKYQRSQNVNLIKYGLIKEFYNNSFNKYYFILFFFSSDILRYLLFPYSFFFFNFFLLQICFCIYLLPVFLISLYHFHNNPLLYLVSRLSFFDNRLNKHSNSFLYIIKKMYKISLLSTK